MPVLVDYSSIQTLPEIWRIAADRFSNTCALDAPHNDPQIRWSYAELYQRIQLFASGLQALGISPQAGEPLPPRLALFADNSPRWFVADQGMMLAGAANAVRSAVADREELLFILNHSGSQALVVENLATWQRLEPGIEAGAIQFCVLLTTEAAPDSKVCPVLNYENLMEKGRSSLSAFQAPQGQREDLATLIYTSGTTGKPKGVMLSHRNLLHQICNAGTVVQPEVGDRILSILPTWHSYERTVEYFLLSQGCTQIYTNIRQIKKDFAHYAPQYMVSVPRIWESIYEGIQQEVRKQPQGKQNLVKRFLSLSDRYIQAKRTASNLNLEDLRPTSLQRGLALLRSGLFWPGHALGKTLIYKTIAKKATGGKLKQVISGGGSLAKHLDLFFETIGVELLVGYGLTETAPILTVRRSEHNLRGSAGLPLAQTEIKVVHPETRQPLGIGERGLVLARGPQIMQGYFQNPEATTKAIDSDGWFDTGDLGMLVPQGDLVLTGRAKDTIVLTNGENIEPQPIEDACLRSIYIDQIMLVGQDQKSLGALIVPNCAALQQWASQEKLSLDFPEDLSTPLSPAQQAALETPQVQNLIRQELAREVKDRPSYRADDRITVFRILQEPFSITNGLMTQTLKIRRPVVTERYQAMIDEMFS
ncbi:MAG: AMP-binding protein [Prochlorotrichaceae cyanobacterium]|jgi:long-chain acyl-CoA synthetase